MKINTAIIGAGIGGLGTAIRLAIRGYHVDVYERSSTPGGKVDQVTWNGYRWDTGPSLFTLPEQMESLYLMAGEEMKVSARYHQLDVVTKYFYEDGKIINAYGNPERFAKEVEEKTGEPARRIARYLQKAKTMYELTRDVFIFNSFATPSTFVSKKFLKAMIQAWKLDSLSTMHRSNARRFDSPHLVQLFDRYATYNGSNPYKAPGTLNMISHLEHNLGAYFPEKGMYTLAHELYELAGRVGVQFHFDTPVEEVILEDRRVKGVRVNGEKLPYSLVVSDVDIYYLYRDLLPGVKMPSKYFNQERSTSALIFHWAVEKEFPSLEIHNILFSENYREEFEHLFSTKDIYEDPTVYIFISSKMVEGDAPQGGENWFVMINVPENVGQDWDAAIGKIRAKILSKINRMLDTDIGRYIRHEFVNDPRTIEANTFSYRGSLYGNSSNSKLSAFSRHPNFRKDMNGLYFVGGSVHPGGGIPLCLASAHIVDHHIAKHYHHE